MTYIYIEKQKQCQYFSQISFIVQCQMSPYHGYIMIEVKIIIMGSGIRTVAAVPS